MEGRKAMSRLPEFARPIKEILEARSEEIVLGILTFMVAWVCVWVARFSLRRFFGWQPPTEEDSRENTECEVAEQKERSVKPRFRKRDKVMFYGRKIIRKMGSVGATVHSAADNLNFNAKNRQILSKVFRQILRDGGEREHYLEEKELPSTMLEVDMTDREAESVLPADILYMLKSIKVFGHFERPLFLQLCKKMETLRLAAGQWLFKPGDPDDSIFVVQDGCVEIYILYENREILAKVVQPGESVASLLSILDVLTGHREPYKTVSGRAVQDSTILRLPGTAFNEVFRDSPQSLVRIVQVIMVRLQRVTFMSLHHYLGLTSELVNARVAHTHAHATLSFSQPKNFNASPKTSPKRVKRSASLPRSMTSSDFDAAVSRARVTKDEGKQLRAKAMKNTNGEASEISQSLSTSAPSANQATVTMNNLEDSTADSHQDFSQNASVSFKRLGKKSGIGANDERSNARGRQTDFIDGGHASRPVDQNAQWNAGSKKSPPGNENMGRPHAGGLGGYSVSTIAMHDATDNVILQRATRDLVEILGLADDEMLKGRLNFTRYPPGFTIVRQGAQDSDLLYVLSGNVSVIHERFIAKSHETGTTPEQNVLYHCHKGDLIDSLSVLTGEPSVFSVVASTGCILVHVSKSNFYSIMKNDPSVVLRIAHHIIRRLSPFVRQIDFALDWTYVEAGKAVFRQGVKADSIYIVLNGRLRSVIEESSISGSIKKRLIGEYGRGEIVGLVEVLMQTNRTTTVMAVRDTELAQIPEGLLDAIKQMYPQVVSRLVHLLGTRILGTLRGPSPTHDPLTHQGHHPHHGHHKVTNLSTIATIAIHEDVPILNFSRELEKHLALIGNTLRLNSFLVFDRLGNSAMDSVNEYRLLSWLGMQEDIHRMVIYECDSRMTPWTMRCIRQADCLLFVGLGSHDPKKLGSMEKELEGMSLRCQKELVLLYPKDSRGPRKTADWLNSRGYLFSHHHIRCPNYIFKERRRNTQNKNAGLKDSTPDRCSDFSRLARFLTGTGIGVVLGGGGARGMAHIGIIKAMSDYGIPIDMVGGTSIGSFVGALWAEERDPEVIAHRAKDWCEVMGSLWKKILDLTYPITSMFTGAGFNGSIEGVFHDRQIEDLWIPYFAITTDITSSEQRVHRSGSLWRYVRASMSLSGYLPPLCDPKDGHLLLDGGYVNNVPADVMRELGCQTIIAVDVGSIDDMDLTNYGDSLSGWWLLFKRYWPGTKPIRVPDLNEIQSRLAYVSCVRLLETVKTSAWCNWIRPPIDQFKTLQFYSFDEIYKCGLQHGHTIMEEWKKNGFLTSIYDEKTPEKDHKRTDLSYFTNPQAVNVRSAATFTDLAELVSTIKKPLPIYTEEEEDFDEEDDEDDEIFSVENTVTFDTRVSGENVGDDREVTRGAVREEDDDDDEGESMSDFREYRSVSNGGPSYRRLYRHKMNSSPGESRNRWDQPKSSMRLVLESDNGRLMSVPVRADELGLDEFGADDESDNYEDESDDEKSYNSEDDRSPEEDRKKRTSTMTDAIDSETASTCENRGSPIVSDALEKALIESTRDGNDGVRSTVDSLPSPPDRSSKVNTDGASVKIASTPPSFYPHSVGGVLSGASGEKTPTTPSILRRRDAKGDQASVTSAAACPGAPERTTHLLAPDKKMGAGSRRRDLTGKAEAGGGSEKSGKKDFSMMTSVEGEVDTNLPFYGSGPIPISSLVEGSPQNWSQK